MYRFQLLARSIVEGRMPGLLLSTSCVALGVLVLVLTTGKVSAESDRAQVERNELVASMKRSGCDIIDSSRLTPEVIQNARQRLLINAVFTVDEQGEEKIFCKPGFIF